MRICSLFPGGTEWLYALGLGDAVVGVSHECTYPPEASKKPVVICPRVNVDSLSSDEIHTAVRQALASNEALYGLDLQRLAQLQPDLIVTQTLCEVCAIGARHVAEALRALPRAPRIVSLHAHTLEQLFGELRLLGHVTNRSRVAGQLVVSLTQRMDRVRARIPSTSAPPRVCCLEWLQPLMVAGHWVPEMVERAGGMDVLGRPGEPSYIVTEDAVLAAQPDILVVMPCGFSMERTHHELPRLASQAWWRALPAVQHRRVYVVNGPAYFNCPGPRLIDGVEIFANLFHPTSAATAMPSDAVELVSAP